MNVTGPFICTREAMHIMRGRCKGGRIVNTRSISGIAMCLIFFKKQLYRYQFTTVIITVFTINCKLHCSLCIDNRICTVC